MTIRHFVAAALCTVTLFAHVGQGTAAQPDRGSYPSRPIRVVVPFTPGGQPDIYTRLIQPLLVEAFGQQVIIDNRPGAGGMVGSRIVAEAAPDGYTLLSISSAHITGQFVRKLPYAPLSDFAGVTRTYSAPYVLVAPISSNIRTVKDIISMAKAKPGALNFASAGRGSGTHFAGEMLKFSAGIDVVHVPYSGIPAALTDIIAGRVQLFMAPIGSSAPLIKSGQIRGVGVSSAKRIAALANIATIAESGLPGFEWDSWGSLLLPAKTPRPIVERWSREVRRAVMRTDIQRRLLDIGMEANPTEPRELDELIKRQMDVVGKVAKAAGLAPE
jgi:tripartite-type tricarboxylate transporter receptor subunit TctC